MGTVSLLEGISPKKISQADGWATVNSRESVYPIEQYVNKIDRC
jgi:hypothetical protein